MSEKADQTSQEEKQTSHFSEMSSYDIINYILAEATAANTELTQRNSKSVVKVLTHKEDKNSYRIVMEFVPEGASNE